MNAFRTIYRTVRSFLPSEKKVKDLVVTRDHVERKAPVFDLVGPRMEEAA